MFKPSYPNRIRRTTFTLTLVLLISGIAAAAMDPIDSPGNDPQVKYRDFLNHLKGRGYTVLARKKALYFKHERAINFMFREYRGGYLMTSTYRGSTYAKSNHAEFLGLCNEGNSMATVAKFYLDKDRDFIIEAWYGGKYDRKRFNDFLDTWNNDWLMLYRKAKEKMVKLLT